MGRAYSESATTVVQDPMLRTVAKTVGPPPPNQHLFSKDADIIASRWVDLLEALFFNHKNSSCASGVEGLSHPSLTRSGWLFD